MGTYLNPGYERFRISTSGEIYIDKTEMISYINSVVSTPFRYISVSRPRRFGKSMAADMLCAYYDRGTGNRTLFENLKISKCKDWDKYIGQFDVIRLVMTDFLSESKNASEMIAFLTEELLSELMETYPDVDYGTRRNLRIVMNKIYGKYQRKFVIVIDEWDAIFREYRDEQEDQRMYLDFLRDWLKDQEFLALAYLTGILPIKKYGKHSALNMFQEYSMIAPMQLARYTGFTTDEVVGLCQRYGRDFEQIREWYDGYQVTDIIPPDPDHEIQKETGKPLEPPQYSLYSPLSVVNAVRTGLIQNYWNKTETYEALAEYICMDYDGLKEAITLLMDKGRVKVDLRKYQNDMTTFHSKDDIFALLIHLGYLGYNFEAGEVFIPNREILDEFQVSTSGVEWEPAMKAFKRSQRLLQATWDCDEEKVAELLEQAHNQAGNKTYNDEAALSYAIQLAYYSAGKYYTTILELDTGKGYADIVYLPSPKYPDKPAILIELKYDKSTDAAIDQIHRQEYPDRLEHYKGNLLLVALNYDKTIRSGSSEFKHHSCVIEKK